MTWNVFHIPIGVLSDLRDLHNLDVCTLTWDVSLIPWVCLLTLYISFIPTFLHCTNRLKTFSLMSETRRECPLSALLFNTILEVLARAIKQDKEIKSTQTRKEEVTLFLFAGGKISYRDSPKKLLELINNMLNFRVQSQHTEIHCLLDTKNETSEKEINNSYIIASKVMKYLEIDLTKEVKICKLKIMSLIKAME